MSSAAPVDPVSETPAPEPSSQAPEPSSPQPTTPPPQSSVEPTTPPAQSSQPPAESSQPPAPSSQQPTTQPPASSQQTEAPSPTPSPTPSPSPETSQQPTTPPASSVQQQSVAPSPTPSVAVSASAQDITSAIPDVTTTDAQGSTITSRPAYITKEITSVDGNGRVLTVTQIVHNPNGGNDGGSANLSGSDAFFDNTGAVAGTFVVVGLAVTAGIMAFIFFMLKRRRRQRLDRDVAAAAAAATAAHRSGFDDDDMDEKHNSAGYYGAATDIHGEPQPNMAQYDYEDPAGGYDHYATSMPIAGDRSSTATAAGLAGFGAQSAQHGYETQHGLAYVPEEYENLADQPHQSQGGYNAVTRAEGPADGTNGGYYFDPKEASAFYAEESYGGYEEHPRPAHNRSDSHGSVARDQGEERDLKITNV